MYETTPGTGDRGTSQVAREQGQQVKGSAQKAASNVAGTAGERARDIKDEASSHARGLVSEARSQVRGRMEQETERAGSALSQAGTQLQALAEGRTDEAGVFGEYAQQAARAVNRWADSVQERGFDGLLDDLRSVARRRPGVFLLGAVAAGVVAGRFGRNLREEMSDGSGNGQRALPSGRTFVGHDETDEVQVVGGPSRAAGQRPPATPPTPTTTPTTPSAAPTTPPPPVASPAEPGGTGNGPHGDPLRDDSADARTAGGDIGYAERADADERGTR
jgi:hypothetical protein